MDGNWDESIRIHGKKNAVALFKEWREECLNQLKKAGHRYEIINDDENLFKITWGNCKEQMGILIY